MKHRKDVLDDMRGTLNIMVRGPRPKSRGWYTQQMYAEDVAILNSSLKCWGLPELKEAEGREEDEEQRHVTVSMLFYSLAAFYMTDPDAMKLGNGGLLLRPLHWHRWLFEKFPGDYKRPGRNSYGVLLSFDKSGQLQIQAVMANLNDEDMKSPTIFIKPWVAKGAMLLVQLSDAGKLRCRLNKKGEWVLSGSEEAQFKFGIDSLSFYPNWLLKEMEIDMPLYNENLKKKLGHGFSGLNNSDMGFPRPGNRPAIYDQFQ